MDQLMEKLASVVGDFEPLRCRVHKVGAALYAQKPHNLSHLVENKTTKRIKNSARRQFENVSGVIDGC